MLKKLAVWLKATLAHIHHRYLVASRQPFYSLDNSHIPLLCLFLLTFIHFVGLETLNIDSKIASQLAESYGAVWNMKTMFSSWQGGGDTVIS